MFLGSYQSIGVTQQAAESCGLITWHHSLQQRSSPRISCQYCRTLQAVGKQGFSRCQSNLLPSLGHNAVLWSLPQQKNRCCIWCESFHITYIFSMIKYESNICSVHNCVLYYFVLHDHNYDTCSVWEMSFRAIVDWSHTYRYSIHVTSFIFKYTFINAYKIWLLMGVLLLEVQTLVTLGHFHVKTLIFSPKIFICKY